MTRTWPSPGPALTAQRPKRNRVYNAVFFGAFLVLHLFVLGGVARQYFGDPTDDNLLIVAIFACSILVWILPLLFVLVPKVDFFEDHLVDRSPLGVSRKRSYQQIKKIEMRHGHLFFICRDGHKVALGSAEISLDELVNWLVNRGVTAARDLELGVTD